MATSGRRIEDRDRERIRTLSQRGVHVSEIARREMVSRPTVRKILSESR